LNVHLAVTGAVFSEAEIVVLVVVIMVFATG
jgi:hypothetical protein